MGVKAHCRHFHPRLCDCVEHTDGLSGCFVLPSSSNGWKALAYLFTTSFQIVLFLCNVLKGLQHWRGRNPENLTTVLYRDALIVFLVQSSLGVINTVLIQTTQTEDYSLDATYRAFLWRVLSSTYAKQPPHLMDGTLPYNHILPPWQKEASSPEGRKTAEVSAHSREQRSTLPYHE
ncbi:hypothetical protein CALCODRAFT_286700 [Calocera cornea HHB12733]|uniref:Uncharacterized protein n=1 Tax=Calocera cornea HHB12733 TaxID=1353952 RepID=A0A165FXC8_9BASI|nr:hypothetical protein CALCODRAFT_286700 [Calocera cornea HHB12733]